jgi:serine/threonine-protein kinase
MILTSPAVRRRSKACDATWGRLAAVDSELNSDAVTEFLDPVMLRARARVGQVLRQKWRLDVLLGVGGMGAVYAATHRNGTRAAIKLLHAELTSNAQVRTRFLREGRAANAVAHEGVVRVVDDDVSEDGSLFLVTELLDGESVEERRTRFGGRLSEDEVLSIADQLLDALAAAHDKGVIHRDLKPENVFLTRDGRVKVIDFGIARLRELSTVSTATQSGTSMGTPAFMPPEQARGLWDEVDGRSDLWAVGATMFALLTGQLVHDGRTSNEQLLSAMTKPAPPIASVAAGVGPAVAHLIDRALAFDRDKRWPDARRMQEAVRRAYHDRFGAPISTAPRLDVPTTVPNRTLASTTSVPITPNAATTGQAVATSRGAAVVTSVGARLPPVAIAGIAVGSTLAIGAVIAVAVAVTSARREAPSPPAASTVVSAAVSVSTPNTSVALPSAAAPSASAPPEIAASDLPSASAAPPPIPRTVPSARPAPTPTAAPPRTSCNPPFTLDPATGKKHFRAECL